jgi:hypothetical protein
MGESKKQRSKPDPFTLETVYILEGLCGVRGKKPGQTWDKWGRNVRSGL